MLNDDSRQVSQVSQITYTTITNPQLNYLSIAIQLSIDVHDVVTKLVLHIKDKICNVAIET